MKARQYINMVGMTAAVLLSSCVKDTLYDTPHPDYGKIAVTADWSACGEGINIPATWTVTMGDYTGTETSATHQVALLACFGDLVVELSGLEHRPQIPGFLLTHVITYFRNHFPECIAAVLVAPRPRSP